MSDDLPARYQEWLRRAWGHGCSADASIPCPVCGSVWTWLAAVRTDGSLAPPRLHLRCDPRRHREAGVGCTVTTDPRCTYYPVTFLSAGSWRVEGYEPPAAAVVESTVALVEVPPDTPIAEAAAVAQQAFAEAVEQVALPTNRLYPDGTPGVNMFGVLPCPGCGDVGRVPHAGELVTIRCLACGTVEEVD